jgi:putative ABC transport system substrate-binding protein
VRRRDFITLLGGAAAAWPLGTRARQPKRMRRIGVLSPLSPSQAASPPFEACRKALRELNHIEDKDVSFIYRWADGNRDRLVDLAAELASLKVDLIFSRLPGRRGRSAGVRPALPAAPPR